MIPKAIDPFSSSLNTIIVAGFRSPGRARISGAGKTLRWDIKPSYGFSGAPTIFIGRSPAEFTVYIDLWKKEQFIEWEVFKKVFDLPQKPIGTKMALGISHPLLADLGIDTVVMKRRGQFEINANGIWTVPIDLLEFGEPVKAIVKPRGAVPAVAVNVPVALTEVQKAIVEERKIFLAAQARANE